MAFPCLQFQSMQLSIPLPLVVQAVAHVFAHVCASQPAATPARVREGGCHRLEEQYLFLRAAAPPALAGLTCSYCSCNISSSY